MKEETTTFYGVFRIEITQKDKEKIKEKYGNTWRSGDLTQYALEYKKEEFKNEPIAMFEDKNEAWEMAGEKNDDLFYYINENGLIDKDAIFAVKPISCNLTRLL